ncbi:cupin domain-containing protein [Nocardioides aquiterrae]|uniref:Cupin domain-containing protein n=1 Tax=Nocardioides aquiterrae TaxID=203799 RepID=A0ABP4EVZ6_9ACTN
MITTHLDDVAWPEAQPIAPERVLSGSPRANTVVLHKDERSELGLWQISPGEFTTVHQGYVEAVTIASGRGRLIHENGTVTHLRPGSVAVLEEGWAGRWVVEETIVKCYAVVSVDA